MRFKSWASKTLATIALIGGVWLGTMTKVSTQSPFVLFGNNSGAAQVINATSNALWVKITGGTATLTSANITTLNTTTACLDVTNQDNCLVRDGSGNFALKQREPVPSAPSAALKGAGAGNVDNGTHVYQETCITPTGETTGSASSGAVTVTDKTVNGQVTVTLTACSSVATGRNLYRSKANTATPLFLVAASPVVADGSTTTTYTDNIADASLQAANPPVSNTTLDIRWTTSPSQFLLRNGSAAAPSLAFASDPGAGIWRSGTPPGGRLIFGIGGTTMGGFSTVYSGTSNAFVVSGTTSGVVLGGDANTNAGDVFIVRDGAANTLALKNGTNAQTFRIYNSTTGPAYAQLASPADGKLTFTGFSNTMPLLQFGGTTSSFPALKQTTSMPGTSLAVRGADDVADANLSVKWLFPTAAAPTVATGTGISLNLGGAAQRVVYKITITSPAFIAAATTADVTIATLPAKMALEGVYADLTQTFACASVCTTSTLSMTLGSSAGGNDLLVSFDADAAVARFGLVDTDLGTGINRANAVQGGKIFSWTGTTPVSLRLTSGTGNIGTGAATNLSQGSVTFYLVTEQMP